MGRGWRRAGHVALRDGTFLRQLEIGGADEGVAAELLELCGRVLIFASLALGSDDFFSAA